MLKLKNPLSSTEKFSTEIAQLLHRDTFDQMKFQSLLFLFLEIHLEDQSASAQMNCQNQHVTTPCHQELIM